ncbi:MAG: FtsX-like permease family protein [Bacteroidales bacterium]|nr:FtsX-like permease family protein [Bacteroidales bacterium]
MNLEYFIAKRLFFKRNHQEKKSEPATKIAIIGISVGLAVMLIAWAVVMGFRQEVRNKIIGINSHIQITSYYSNYTYEMNPVNAPDSLLDALRSVPGVGHVQRLYTKPGMIKTESDFQTVVFKGADADFDKKFLTKNLVQGVFPDFTKPSNEVLISEYLSKLLKLRLGDSFLAYFIKGESVSARKLKISGIYNTHFSEFDKYFLIADARHVRHLNDWSDNQAAGVEIFVKDMDRFDQVEEGVYAKMARLAGKNDDSFYMRNLYEMNPDLFSWLHLLDMNVWLILVLMICVSGFNIISGLLILILENTNLIGMFKAMGANNISIRRIFIYLSTFLIVKGLFWGNIIGLGCCLIQKFFHVIHLNPATYYVDFVPIELDLTYILLVNVGTVLISLMVVLLPTALISHINPAKAIRFD